MISRLVLSTVLTSDFFKKLRTIRTNEALEEYYSEVLEELFDTLGLKFKRNKSTYPDYEFNTDDKLEVKSTRTNRIKLNDTIPCPDVWYLVLLTSKDKFVMCRGSQLITDEERQKLTKLKEIEALLV